MEQIFVKARAKINLALNIKHKRPDGYHELESIMQTLALHDTIQIKKVHKEDYGIKLRADVPWLPTDERNLAYQAASYLKEAYNIETGIFISIKKTIPISAGLGGGSADCAATLVGIRNLFSLPISDRKLIYLAKRFGADVPFCVMRGTALAKGVGEILTPLERVPRMHIVVIRPPITCSTKEIFARYNPSIAGKEANISGVIYHIKRKNVAGMCENMGNMLEGVAIGRHPQIAKIKEFLSNNKAKKAMMSGSGAAVFGIYTSYTEAKRAVDKFLEQEEFVKVKDVFLTRPF